VARLVFFGNFALPRTYVLGKWSLGSLPLLRLLQSATSPFSLSLGSKPAGRLPNSVVRTSLRVHSNFKFDALLGFRINFNKSPGRKIMLSLFKAAETFSCRLITAPSFEYFGVLSIVLC